MGLWMKCPKCQTHNPLFLKACANCGTSLENLPEKKRIYTMEPPGPPKPEATGLLTATHTPESPLPAKTAEPQAAPAKPKAPRKPRKKKS